MASSLAEVLGLFCLTVTAFLIAIPLGWAIAGVALLLIGQALDDVDVGEAVRRRRHMIVARSEERDRSQPERMSVAAST